MSLPHLWLVLIKLWIHAVQLAVVHHQLVVSVCLVLLLNLPMDCLSCGSI